MNNRRRWMPSVSGPPASALHSVCGSIFRPLISVSNASIHRVKVIAGAGSNDTSAAVYLSQHAEDSGADALLHVTPYYNKCSQEGLIRHYECIADRAELPIILYNIPSRTGVSFTADTYRTLSQNPKINGVKEAGREIFP